MDREFVEVFYFVFILLEVLNEEVYFLCDDVYVVGFLVLELIFKIKFYKEYCIWLFDQFVREVNLWEMLKLYEIF